jgi:hypothetical protein
LTRWVFRQIKFGMMRVLIFILVFLLPALLVRAQINDSLRVDTAISKKKVSTSLPDTVFKPKHSPRKATIRSAILPGWGQVYNKKYWKVPIVYTAIGIPVGTFLYNKKWYNRTRDAAKMLSADPPDTNNYKQRVNEKLWIFFDNPNALPSLLNYRNEFRRNMDYSLLFVLLMWGLNVVDATVDGHLKEFDVSDNLSFHVKPTILQGTTTAGISVVFTIGRNGPKNITSR